MFKLLDTPIARHPGSKSLPVEQVKGEIILDSVTFAYHDRQPVIQDFSLSVLAGQTIAIVGATGSGKSTIVKLLLRLYEIKSGHITLDGLDIQDIMLSDLRRAIGLVSQDVFLFHGTVAENIRYGSFEPEMRMSLPPPPSPKPIVLSKSYPKDMKPSLASEVKSSQEGNDNG